MTLECAVPKGPSTIDRRTLKDSGYHKSDQIRSIEADKREARPPDVLLWENSEIEAEDRDSCEW